ncbi:phosphoenolpyruvate--protein phosphotransferase [Agromyces seonyuensis]|uniref:Phosphoenolpyruvate-protein phosphotransferase n=1 Tax=Agromyces seonyuensis TaxID=2662446 RepID=A0A6I4NY79_9MICO|nr:phosphoenolpyruvate--protein phosphotransferase [Agromyces seonyuensis]MWB99218.1 phosphoenolpyruvate--protein phosphotransferase [Agromyces seonyuensis]
MAGIHGIGIGTGVAVGEVAVMAPPAPDPLDEPSTAGPSAEAARAAEALAAVASELRSRGERAGGTAGEVLDAQALMTEDPGLQDAVGAAVADGKTAERAVFEAFAAYQAMFASLGGYQGERAADLGDVSQRVVAHLRGVPAPGLPERESPYVLVAKDLAPADTALLDYDLVVAIVTEEGGPSSHTAILAREHGVVAVLAAAGAGSLREGQTVIVDAAAGLVVPDPDPAAVTAAEQRIAEAADLAAAPVTPGALADGTAVPLLANLGSPAGAAKAVELGAEGVGLFRTEFMFLDTAKAPSVEAQQAAFRELFEAFGGKRVVIRVLDAGADKPLDFLTDADEPNPALGVRGIRSLLAHEEVLRAQLEAIAAAADGTSALVEVMAPMVATVDEAAAFTTLVHSFGLPTGGVMIEVPSAALLADRVLAVTEFASIGTNDLTQYTLAADRLLGSLARLQSTWHPAVLQLVKSAGDAGARLGRHVGICGEAAGDPLLAIVLVGLGATSLSMSPPSLAAVRRSLARVTLADAKLAAAAALAATGADEAEAAARASVDEAVAARA